MGRSKSPEQAEKILVAASGLFATLSFHQARMEDISTAAGVGKGTLYRYFHDKEELYLALLDWAADNFRAHIDRGQHANTSPRARLESLVGAILEFFDAKPYLFDLIQHAEAQHRTTQLANWKNVRQGNIRLALDIIEQGQLSGCWKIPDPEIPVLMLLGGLRSVLLCSATPRPANLAQRIVADFLHGADQPPGGRSGRRTADSGGHDAL
jgi:AcrR family transcriptional regulator